MSSASRDRCKSMHRFGVSRLKNAERLAGFLADSSSRRRRPNEAMKRLKQRSGPAPPEDGPIPGCPARLPRAMKETGRSSASRPREPSRGPGRGAKSSQGQFNSGSTSLCNAERGGQRQAQ